MNNTDDTELERVTEPDQTGDVRLITDLLTADPTVAMVMTMVGRHHSSRPVTCADVQDHRLSFLVSRQAEWVDAIANSQALVHVTVSDDAHTTYLSLNGGAMVVTDPSEIVRLWSPAARAWFEGPDDPDVAVLHFDISDGEYWDGPGGRVGRAVALLRAAFTGSPESLGTQGQIEGDSASYLSDDIARYGNTPDRRAG
jgi:general stress protein 26